MGGAGMNGSATNLELIHMPAQSERFGPPLLFAHGGFHGAWCWADHFMPWFAERGFDCHAVSYRDHGESALTGQHGEWRLKDYVDDVRWATEQLPEKPILCGHSLGGTIVQKLAAEGGYPGMILLAPSPIGGSNRAAMRMLFSFPGPMYRGLIRGDLPAALPAFLSFFLSDDVPPTERDRIAARCTGLTSHKAANDAFYFDCAKPKALGIPALVVSGEKDWSIPQYKNAKLARAYGAEHIVVPTAHDIMCDTQWEQAADQIAVWLLLQFGR
jgi:pimeloyl-ACP methyl ester carboxylesterase